MAVCIKTTPSHTVAIAVRIKTTAPCTVAIAVRIKTTAPRTVAIAVGIKTTAPRSVAMAVCSRALAFYFKKIKFYGQLIMNTPCAMVLGPSNTTFGRQ
jgi:hypothetical protein